MTTAVDDELTRRRRQALERHLAGCASCAREMATTERLMTALAALPLEAAVSAQLEQATMRRVRLEAGDDAVSFWERLRGRWLTWSVPALATVAVAVIAVVGTWRSPSEITHVGRSEPARESAHAAPASQEKAPAVASVKGEAGTQPPPDLAEVPDLFIDLSILRNMEKLQHFESIRTTTLDDGSTPDQEPQSNG